MKSPWIFLIINIKTENQGQSMVEYILIISLIAIAIILAVTNFGDALLELYTEIRDLILNL